MYDLRSAETVRVSDLIDWKWNTLGVISIMHIVQFPTPQREERFLFQTISPYSKPTQHISLRSIFQTSNPNPSQAPFRLLGSGFHSSASTLTLNSSTNGFINPI